MLIHFADPEQRTGPLVIDFNHAAPPPPAAEGPGRATDVAADADLGEHQFVPRLARADEELNLFYFIAMRPDTVDSWGTWISYREVEKALHRFVAESRIVTLNHACANEGCFHSALEHADHGPCRAAGCLCTGYKLLEAPVTLVEAFQYGGPETTEWHGKPLAESFMPGDGIIAVHCEHPVLWMLQEMISGASIEGRATYVPDSQPPSGAEPEERGVERREADPANMVRTENDPLAGE